jgi:hypothetical protein
MSLNEFNRWLSRYKSAWEELDPRGAKALFTEDARYFETPFSEPLKGIKAIYDYWSAATDNQANVQFSHQAISFKGHTGVARWQAAFTRLHSGEPVVLDGMLQAIFDNNALCITFREWWHRLEGATAEKWLVENIPDRDMNGHRPVR